MVAIKNLKLEKKLLTEAFGESLPNSFLRSLGYVATLNLAHPRLKRRRTSEMTRLEAEIGKDMISKHTWAWRVIGECKKVERFERLGYISVYNFIMNALRDLY